MLQSIQLSPIPRLDLTIVRSRNFQGSRHDPRACARLADISLAGECHGVPRECNASSRKRVSRGCGVDVSARARTLRTYRFGFTIRSLNPGACISRPPRRLSRRASYFRPMLKLLSDDGSRESRTGAETPERRGNPRALSQRAGASLESARDNGTLVPLGRDGTAREIARGISARERERRASALAVHVDHRSLARSLARSAI
jgi:hypothetical protein